MSRVRQSIASAALAASIAASVSCGDVVRQGHAPMFLVIDSLTGTRGGGLGSTSNFLLSDVITIITSPAPCTTTAPCPTVFDDAGSALFHLAPKNVQQPLAPSSNNDVTITRYRVEYRRTDGLNTPGVDVPYGFDAAATGTIPANGTASVGFELVRHTAKEESPLVQLKFNPTIISTIATITFYGRDQVGNDISATGSIQVNFGDFGDSK
jgi:hypothetical protein